ncbi:MAG: AgmX/PglI C-terminal domain-containing protein [Proteobacteria bacterium]|nr:AgmX/PglI C-terminal domain-containing protein [Pseudomonadota bacterium]
MTRSIFLIALCAILMTACSPKSQPPQDDTPTTNTADTPQAAPSPLVLEDAECVRQYDETENQKQDFEAAVLSLESIPDEDRSARSFRSPVLPFIQTWSKANNRFGLKSLMHFEGNAMFSPFSAERTMGMLIDGACNETFADLTRGMEIPRNSYLSQLGSLVAKEIGTTYDDREFISDNRIWLNNQFALRQSYMDAIKLNYGIEPTSLDFTKDPDGAVRTINASAEESTHSRIKTLVDNTSIDDSMPILLTNALYFKSRWEAFKFFFKDHTYEQDFYNDTGTVRVNMMHRELACSYPYFLNIQEEFVSLTIPFYGEFWYTAVLPTLKADETPEAALQRVEAQFYRDYDTVFSFSKPINVSETIPADFINISMPRIEIQADIELDELMKKLGITNAWEKAKAKAGELSIDFAGMNGYSSQTVRTDENRFLYLDKFKQKVFIRIDENGSETPDIECNDCVIRPEASTKRLIEKTRQPTYLDITFDHPFFFMISHIKQTPTLLFVGQVIDPTVSQVTLKLADGKRKFDAHGITYPEYFYKVPQPYQYDDQNQKVSAPDSVQNLVYSPKTSIQYKSPTVTGNIDKRIIQKIVRMNKTQLQVCYEQEIEKNPRLEGHIIIQSTIDQDGKVTETIVKESTLPDKKIENCFVKTMRNFNYPSPKGGGTASVEFPFVFEVE